VGREPIGGIWIAVLSGYLILFSVLLLYSIVRFWPGPSDAAGTAVTYFVWRFTLSEEIRLVLVVILTGALGAMVHALRSFYWYVGNRIMVWSWLPKYILLPFVGSTLGLVFYLVIRGGFFSPQATASEASPFAFAALSGLVGLFSEQALLKLKEVAETLLAKPKPGENSKPQE
jgi:hypothetical protein